LTPLSQRTVPCIDCPPDTALNQSHWRIVINAPGGVIAFDSLFDGAPAVAILPGSLVLFIGSAGTAFEASVS
jgi:hypothetical protein